MKYYDYKTVYEYIEKNKEAIEEVSLGMQEDWGWTSETVYSNGDYLVNLAEKPFIRFIDGSRWATPVMEVSFKTKTFDAYTTDDGSTQKETESARETQDFFGGMFR